MRLVLNLALSLAMLALCLWLVWPDPITRQHLSHALGGLDIDTFWPYLAAYLGLLAVTHFARAWRWNNLLAPLGVTLSPGRLLAISSVGFMAILCLPARLGEFVRPALIRKKGHVSASAALGTVAVERIVDGLMISLFLVVAIFALPGPGASGWVLGGAYAALGIFFAATVFLVFAMRKPEATVRFSLKLTLLPRLAPRAASVLETKLLEMIRGFAVLKDPKNLLVFTSWSLIYWVANGLSLWVLARGFDLPLSVMGSFGTMAVVAIGITLPNTPGLVGQYQALVLAGLSLYLGSGVLENASALHGTGLAYAIVLHGLQVVWYVGVGALAIATPYVSFAETWQARKLDPAAGPE